MDFIMILWFYVDHSIAHLTDLGAKTTRDLMGAFVGLSQRHVGGHMEGNIEKDPLASLAHAQRVEPLTTDLLA
jgi:hypothetical protein